MRIAVIPARGSSKRIPRKNIKLFCGKPMIAWSIEAALSSNLFDRVVVSTDDDEIASVASAYGAEVPFMRPLHLADDFTGTGAVVAHALQWYQDQNMHISKACCIYATAPFVQAKDLVLGLDVLDRTSSMYAVSVTSFPFPIQRAVRITESGRLGMFNPEFMSVRSQDLPEAYHDAGQFYWGLSQAWLENTPIFSEHAAAVCLDRNRVQDIDTPEDWLVAEAKFLTLQTLQQKI